MRKILLSLFWVACTLVPNVALAASFSEACPDIPTCAKNTSELLGQKYIFDSDMKGKVLATPNLEFTKENAEWNFTNMLHIEGYSRVPQGSPNTYIIMRQRDAKDSAIPLYECSQQIAPSMPNNWDYATLRYKATHPDAVDGISRMTRNFMPPNSRIISDEVSGSLLVTDTIPNLRKMYDLVKGLDQKPTAELKKKWAEEERMRHAERMSRHDEHPQGPPQGPPPGSGQIQGHAPRSN